jgi:hypothetical protein
MKRLLFIALAAFATQIHGNAQNKRFGITAGTTLANYKATSDGTDESGNVKQGFTAGIFVNLPIAKNIFVQPGLNWVQKGTTDEQTTNGLNEKLSLNTNHFEIPVNFIYRGNGFFIGAGPSFSFAFSGKLKYSSDVLVESDNVHFGNSENDILRSFDLGVNFLTGYEFKSGFMISTNYNQGLSNLTPGGSANGTNKSHYFGIKLGYAFHMIR